MITDYSSLQTAVGNWLHRTDLTGVIPDLIALGEQRMNSDIVARDMDTTVTLTTVAGNPLIATPSDVLESVRMTIQTTPNRTLNYLAPEAIKNQFSSIDTGAPEAYTVLGNNFEFAPVPDSAYSIEYIYRQRIPALSVSTTTNWLLTKWPYVYLYAALVESAPYLGQDQRIAVWEGKYQDLVDNINKIDWYTGTSMRVRAI
jgi:hypothetical protein